MKVNILKIKPQHTVAAWRVSSQNFLLLTKSNIYVHISCGFLNQKGIRLYTCSCNFVFHLLQLDYLSRLTLFYSMTLGIAPSMGPQTPLLCYYKQCL